MLRIGFALLGALAVVTSSVSGKAQTPTADHRWAGIVFDAFAWDTGSDLIEAWSVDDGGRIRHRRPSDGVWEFQDVHDPVRDTLHRVTFLTTGPQAGDLGWAVGQGGWVLKTTSGGAPSGSTPGWQPACPQVASQASSGDDPFEELYDVHFVNASDGWLCGKHSLWWTDNGGTTWTQVTVVDPGPPSTFLDLADFELYAVDVVDRGGSRLGLAVMEPGIVLRSDSTQSGPNLTQWQAVFDMRDLCPRGGDVNDCLNATGGVLKGCECEVCAPAGVGGPHFEPWDVEISRNEAPGMKLALFTGGIVFQCGMVFSSTDDGSTWTKDKHECECPGATGCHPIACTLDPLYNDDPSNSFDITRHKEFKTLYGLGISEGDNSAVAAGSTASSSCAIQ